MQQLAKGMICLILLQCNELAIPVALLLVYQLIERLLFMPLASLIDRINFLTMHSGAS